MSVALRAHADSFLQAILLILAPPAAPRRLSEVARTLRITEGKRGPRPEVPQGDLLDPDEHHGQRAALRLLASARYRVVVVLAPPQDGKDTGVVAPILVWAINDLRRPIVYATTDRRLIGALWRAKIEATMRASGYGHLFPDDGMGSNGGTPDEFLFANGVRSYLLGAGASNGAGQAGVTAWLVVITEADKLRTAQREWLQDRNKSYSEERLSLLIGTLDRDGDGGLWSMYNESCLGRLHHPCRHCGAWQPLDPAQVTFDAANADLARETARITCRANGCLWTEDDRQWSCRRSTEVFGGQTIAGPAEDPIVTGAPVASDYGGLRLWAMDSPFRSLPEFAAEKRRCQEILARTGDHEPLRAFTRAEEVMPYRNREEVLELREADLALRSAAAMHKRGECPADAEIITVGQDQQLRRSLFVTIAYRRRDANWWIIDYGFKGMCPEAEEPTEPQAHAGFDHVAQRVMHGYPRPSGILAKPQMGGIDTADGNTRARALSWLANRPGWYAIRGERGEHHSSDATGEAIFRLPSVLTIYRQTKTIPHWLQLAPDVDALKSEIMRGLSRKSGDVGAGHLPLGEGSHDDLIQQLCAERLEMTPTGPRWMQKRRHNHYLDALAYALAQAKYLDHLQALSDQNTNGAATDYATAMEKS